MVPVIYLNGENDEESDLYSTNKGLRHFIPGLLAKRAQNKEWVCSFVVTEEEK